MLLEQIGGALDRAVESVLLARGHHHPPANGVQRVRHHPRGNGDRVPHQEVVKQVADHMAWQDRLHRVVQAEVKPSVDHHEHARNHESPVQTAQAVRGIGLPHAVHYAFKLASGARPHILHIVGEPGAHIVQRVHEELRGGSRDAAVDHVEAEASPEGGFGLVVGEKLAVEVFEGKIERLGGEVAEDVGEVALVVGP